MIVINDYDNVYPEDGIRNFNWEKYESQAKNCILFNGGPKYCKMLVEPGVEKLLIYLEEQLWDRDTTELWTPYVDKIFTILNPRISGRYNKRQSVYFPLDLDIVRQLRFEKEFDVGYAGVASAPHVEEIISTITGYNYRWISYGKDLRVTDHNVSFLDKLGLLSKCRVVVCHGLTGTGTPQTKTKYFYAAFCKSLILMKRDSWNCIEEWFNPEEDFVYFSNQFELDRLIRDAITNPDKYYKIIDCAFQKALNRYTTKNFVADFIGWK